MLISFSNSLANPANLVDSPLPPVFTAPPELTPASGPAGSVFNLGYGTVSPVSAQISAVLTLDGQDVTADITLEPQGLSYTPPLAGPTGPLIWRVSASTAAGSAEAPQMVATVSAATTDVSMGGVTFTLDGAYQTGHDAAGKAYVVVPSGETVVVTRITPDQTTLEGAVVNGVMKNPARTTDPDPDQGYDGRFATYVPAAGEGLPVSMGQGDVLVKTVADPAYEYRKGGFLEIAALHAVSQPLPAGAFLAASVTWADRAGPEWYPADVDAFYNAIARHSSSTIEFPAFTVMMQSVDRFYPLYAQISSVASATGYQNLSPSYFGGFQGNYGLYIAATIEAAMLAITTDVYTPSETKELIARLVQHGIEWGDPMLYGPSTGGNGNLANGGHNQFHQGVTALALAVTGRSDELNLIMERAPGNWEQAIRVDSALHAQFAPHTDPTGVAFSRLRTLAAQPGGAVVSLPHVQGSARDDWYQTMIPIGAQVVRLSDGVAATVVAETPMGFANPKTGVFDVPLDQASPFAPGDEVYIEMPQAWVQVGQYDWTLRGGSRPHMFSPSSGNPYRNLQSWGAIMTLRSLGIIASNMYMAEGYLVRSALTGHPTLDNDYPPVFVGFSGYDGVYYTVAPTYFNRHWNAIMSSTP